MYYTNAVKKDRIMKSYTTIRIYFRYGTRPRSLSWLKRLWGTAFSDELLRRAQQAGIRQVICFHVTVGYLDGKSIDWGLTEVPLPEHPECIELTDLNDRIERFVAVQQDFLEETTVVIVKEPIAILFADKCPQTV